MVVSIFQVNGTDMGEMKVLRGKKNFKDVGRVIAFNGETGELFLSGNFFYEKFILNRLFLQNPMHGALMNVMSMLELTQRSSQH